MTISAIIPTKNRFSDVIVCIESILQQTLLPDEIIVIDASDLTELEEILERKFSKNPIIKYIHSSPGLTLQRNVGVSVAIGDIIFFFDDDVVLEPEFIYEIQKVFLKDKKNEIGGVFGNILPPPSQRSKPFYYQIAAYLTLSFYWSFTTIFLLSKIRKNGRFQKSGVSTFPYGYNTLLDVECVPGGLTAYRKEVFYYFEFDETLQGYCYMEDVDFSYRVAQQFRNVYTPYAKVVHNESPVSRDKRYENRKMRMINHYYLFKKNIPQDFWHVAAFWWSVIGQFLNEIVVLNYDGLRGLFDGFKRRGDLGSTKKVNSHKPPQ